MITTGTTLIELTHKSEIPSANGQIPTTTGLKLTTTGPALTNKMLILMTTGLNSTLKVHKKATCN